MLLKAAPPLMVGYVLYAKSLTGQIDGAVRAVSTQSFNLRSSELGVGAHTVEVEVTDPTALVRKTTPLVNNTPIWQTRNKRGTGTLNKKVIWQVIRN